jgi:NAD(P)-dependent dehydrogenase (short-subunit alcohol dehydrogenase family)
VLRSAKKSKQPALKGKVALITGASRGLGLAIACALAEHGCDLVLTGRSLPPLEKAGRELSRRGVRVLAKLCDGRESDGVKTLAASVRKQFGRVDILINNAGIAHANLAVEKLPFEVWREVIDTNLTGMFLVTREILPLMRKGSAIVNNLSIAARQVFAGLAAYNASKHGALGLTDTLREELRPRGIRVIALLPGATDTDIWQTFWADAPREKMMKPETIAQAVISALVLPENATLEELRILPTAGVL